MQQRVYQVSIQDVDDLHQQYVEKRAECQHSVVRLISSKMTRRMCQRGRWSLLTVPVMLLVWNYSSCCNLNNYRQQYHRNCCTTEQLAVFKAMHVCGKQYDWSRYPVWVRHFTR